MKILFVSLGCDKNLVDSEEMLGDLTQAGYEITDDEEEAEAAVVNTCCFINDAKKESIESILELAERRTAGQLRALIVTGCLAQRYSEDILREIPEVDAVIGTTAQDTLVQTLQEVTGRREISGKEEKDQALVRLNDLRRIPRTDAKRVLTTANGYAYLRIAEGCSKCCTYCVIPSIRGGYRSLPMENVLSTAEDLASQGVRDSFPAHGFRVAVFGLRKTGLDEGNGGRAVVFRPDEKLTSEKFHDILLRFPSGTKPALPGGNACISGRKACICTGNRILS